MKSPISIPIFVIVSCLLFLANPILADEITYFREFEGEIHVTATFGDGSCKTSDNIRIKFYALPEGKTTGVLEARISFRVDFTAGGCIFDENTSQSYYGQYDVANGSFMFPFSGLYDVAFNVTGTFNESQISGSGSGNGKTGPYQFISVTFSGQAGTIDPTPKITLEPAQYPQFQLNILEKSGFQIKIRKEDGIKDEKGNFTLDISTLSIKTNDVDNTQHFLTTAQNQGICGITQTEKELNLQVTPDPNLFMSKHNVFNIIWNGDHKISLRICDKSGHCGESVYSVYFGPFILIGTVLDNCSGETESLSLGKVVLANMGFTSSETSLYLALINSNAPFDYWCFSYYEKYPEWFFWQFLTIRPMIFSFPIPEASFYTLNNFLLHLEYMVAVNSWEHLEPIPPGDYKLLAFLVDNSISVFKGDSKDVKICGNP